MSLPSFNVYIDESGDEGFVFKSDGSGSSRWLVLSAIIVRRKNDLRMVQLLKEIRVHLGKPETKSLHFSKLTHEQRVPYIRRIAESGLFRTVTILVHKPSIREPERFQSQKFQLYRYVTRLLLERVSWLCRDNRILAEGDGSADIVFSNRSIMSYEDLRDYLKILHNGRNSSDVRIEWSVINPARVRAVNHEQLAGLQIADAIASSFYYAVNINRYKEVEDKYARTLITTCYRHKSILFGYGMKFWPDDFEKTKSANPHIAWFADYS